MQQKTYETPNFKVWYLQCDVITTSGEGIAKDVGWKDYNDVKDFLESNS